jgi:photosystem II stability/assembly factor-like uncharacterized protein
MKHLLLALQIWLITLPAAFAQTFWEDANGPEGVNIVRLKYDPQGIVYGEDYGFPVKTIFRSEDAGFHWTPINYPNASPAIKYFDIGLDGTVFGWADNYIDRYYSKDHGDSWSLVNVPGGEYGHMTSNSEGAILMTVGNSIIRTYDNVLWDTLFQIPLDTTQWFNIGFQFGQIGWLSDGRIVAESYYGFNPSSQNISFLISDDDGINWDTFLNPSLSPLGLTLMPNGKFVEINDDYQLCISNLGEAPICLSPPFSTPDAHVANFVVTDSGRLIVTNIEDALFSDDDGASWQAHPLGIEWSLTHEPLPGGYLLRRSFWSGHTTRSSDLGQHWYKVGRGTDRAWSYDWVFKTNERVFAISEGLWRSLDGGSNWELLIEDSLNTNHTFYNLALAPNGDLYALSNQGLYRTTDDGNTLQFIPIDSAFGKSYRVAIHPQTGDIYLTGQKLLRSLDQGQSWVVVNSTQSFFTQPIVFHPNGTLYCTRNKLIRSENNGFTWKEVTVSPTPAYNSFDWVKVLPDGKIVAIGNSGYAISSDDGLSWQRRDVPISPGTYAINALPVLPSTLATGIIHLAIAPDQTLWTCSDGDGHFKSASPTVRVSNPSDSAVGFDLSPNPADEVLRLTLNEALTSDASVALYNVAGQRVRSWNLAAGNSFLSLQVADLPDGVYAVSIENEAVRGVQKVVIR